MAISLEWTPSDQEVQACIFRRKSGSEANPARVPSQIRPPFRCEAAKGAKHVKPVESAGKPPPAPHPPSHRFNRLDDGGEVADWTSEWVAGFVGIRHRPTGKGHPHPVGAKRRAQPRYRQERKRSAAGWTQGVLAPNSTEEAGEPTRGTRWRTGVSGHGIVGGHQVYPEAKKADLAEERGRQDAGPQGSNLVSALAALEEPAGGLDPGPVTMCDRLSRGARGGAAFCRSPARTCARDRRSPLPASCPRPHRRSAASPHAP